MTFFLNLFFRFRDWRRARPAMFMSDTWVAQCWRGR